MATFSKKDYIILSVFFIICTLAYPAYKLVNNIIDNSKIKSVSQETSQEYDGDYEDDYYEEYEEPFEEEPESIEDVIYRRYGDYAVFKTDYEYNYKQIWAVFLRDDEMVIFINTNNLQREIQRGLRYEYEIRDNKLRFFNGFEIYNSIGESKNYPETSAKIYLDGDGVTFANMKQYGNRKNVHISATLTDESQPDEFLDYLIQYARK